MESVTPLELAEQIAKARDLAGAFRVPTVAAHIEKLAEEAVALGDPESTQIATQLLQAARREKFKAEYRRR